MKTTGLTIQEAIQSGKPFMRVNHDWNAWLMIGRSSGLIRYHSILLMFWYPKLSAEDILALDWEIRP
jgi:hypothetical protein